MFKTNSMQVEVIGTAQQVTEELVKGKTVVVIDVLRATTVMITALENGASAVVPVTMPEEAFKVKEQLGEQVLLGGERHAEPIEGFDYGNSPLSYTPSVVADRTLVMTTTNGTLALNNSMMAKELLVAAFINSDVVANYLSDKQEVVLVCSGNNGLYTLEDGLCAGKIIYQLEAAGLAVQCSDFALSQKSLYERHKDELVQLASRGYHYQVLKQKGYTADLQYCFQSHICTNIPVWNGRALVNQL